jgi:hypothetical protein
MIYVHSLTVWETTIVWQTHGVPSDRIKSHSIHSRHVISH